MTAYTHRIRRCGGNKQAWCLVALRDDGTEIASYGGYTSSLSLDALLRHAGGLLPSSDHVVQIIYYADEGAQ